MTTNNIYATDDFKIMINRAIQAFKFKHKDIFINCVDYIIREATLPEITAISDYLYRKLENEVDK